MLQNPIPPAWPYQSQTHGASPRARHGARWHPYESGNGGSGAGLVAGMNGLGDGRERSSSPSGKRRLQITIPGSKCVRSRSLTDMHISSALAPSPLRNCAAVEDARGGQLCEFFAESAPGIRPSLTRQYTAPPPPASALQTPPTVKAITRSILTTPSSGVITPGTATPLAYTPTTIHPARIMVTPASAISPISPVRERSFGLPMTHGRSATAFGEVTGGAAARVDDGRTYGDERIGYGIGEGRAGYDEGRERMDEDDEDARTEVGSPEEDDASDGGALRLPPVRTLPNPALGLSGLAGHVPVLTGAVAQQTRRAMQAGDVSQDLLLYGPAGVTPAPAELARSNACDKLPPLPSYIPRQATFFGIQNLPVADGSSRFATICAPTSLRAPPRPVYPPAGLAPLVAGHQSLPHAGLTALVDRTDEIAEWKERQRAKERADIVVKDGELTAAERVEMEKRVSMSVKVINHIYYGDDVPKTRSPTQPARQLEDDDDLPAGDVTGPSTTASRVDSVREPYWPPTPSSMPSSPESPRTRRSRQRASMRKEVLGETVRTSVKPKVSELEGMGSPKVPEEQEEVDPSREQPARTLTWFVTEVLRRSRTSINVLQVALAYLAGAQPEIHKELRAAANRQQELAIQIAGIPQHVRDALPGMDWLGSEFTPSPLIDPRRTFLASLVLASKFLLDKAFSNKAWAKLSGLEALEVGKCERALGTALNWRLWVGREVSRECVAPAQHDQPPVQPQLVHSPPSYPTTVRPGAWEKVAAQDSPTRSSSPHSISHCSIFTTNSTPSLYSGSSDSELGSESDVPQGYDEFGQWTQTPEPYVTVHESMMAAGREMLHGSPECGYSRAATDVSMLSASDTAAPSHQVLPCIRSFDRPPMRRGPSDLVTPQTESNMGCGHLPPVCVEMPEESPLAYASLDRPWNAMNGRHWDFTTDGVVGA